MSLKTIWITRIIVVAVIIVLGWFFFFSPWSSCNKNDEPQYETAKRDQAKELQITNYRLQIDSLHNVIRDLSRAYDSLERSRHERLVYVKTQREIVGIKSVTYELYPQMRLWLSGNRVLTGKTFEFDSLDVLSMAKKKIEYDYLADDNKLLEDEITNCKLQIANYKWQVSDYVSIINLKDEQIGKLESVPRVTVNSRKWYIDAGIIAGSTAVGFVIGKYLVK